MGLSSWLKNLLLDTSRDDIARELEVHPNALDAWLDQETRPKDENLVVLSEMVSERTGMDQRKLLRSLRLAYGFRALFNEVASATGIRQAQDICQRGVHYANEVLGFPRQSEMSIEENDLKMGMTLALGTFGGSRVSLPWVEAMTHHLRRGEPDPVWRTTLKAAYGDWLPHLQSVAAALGPTDMDEFLKLCGRTPTQEEMNDLAYRVQASKDEEQVEPGYAEASLRQVLAGGKVAALELKLQATNAVNSGDRILAIDLFRAAIANDPTDAELHFRLGASLWQISDDDAALRELELARQLDPKWDKPRVEIAIIHNNAGRTQLALDTLEEAQRALPESSVWLLTHLAYTRERLGKFRESIATYEQVLSLEPEHAEALDRVAHLYFVTGDKGAAARCAKEAKQRGIPTVYDAWKGGHYEGKVLAKRPRHVGLDHVLQFFDPAEAR